MLLAPPLCWSCRAPAGRGRSLCAACRRALVFLAPEPVVLCGLRVWAPVAYEGPGRDLVRALKFHGALGLAGEMAAIVVASAPGELLGGALVPVPLDPRRLRKRGFNQSAVLAGAIARRAQLVVAADCLERVGARPPQVGLTRAARLAGPAGSVTARGAVPPRVVLVDDVVTTGATLAACAAACRAAGAEQVAAIAFARTSGR